MTTTFNIDQNKELLFFTLDMMIINLLLNTICVEFGDQLKLC